MLQGGFYAESLFLRVFAGKIWRPGGQKFTGGLLFRFFIYYLFTVQDLSLEADKFYPSTRLLLTFLLQNNKMHIVQDIKKPISKNMGQDQRKLGGIEPSLPKVCITALIF